VEDSRANAARIAGGLSGLNPTSLRSNLPSLRRQGKLSPCFPDPMEAACRRSKCNATCWIPRAGDVVVCSSTS
jgi:hypothetical protein